MAVATDCIPESMYEQYCPYPEASSSSAHCRRRDHFWLQQSRAEQNGIVTLLCRSYIARSDYVLLTTTTGTLGNDVPGTPVRGKLRQEKLVCLVSSSGSHEAKKYPPQILSYLC